MLMSRNDCRYGPELWDQSMPQTWLYVMVLLWPLPSENDSILFQYLNRAFSTPIQDNCQGFTQVHRTKLNWGILGGCRLSTLNAKTEHILQTLTSLTNHRQETQDSCKDCNIAQDCKQHITLNRQQLEPKL